MTIADNLQAFLAANPSPLEVEVGKLYKVPCIRRVRANGDDDVEWIPVIGPVHDDKEAIGFPHLHVHHDTRFSDLNLNLFMGSLARLGRVERLDKEVLQADRWFKADLRFSMRRRRCKRQTDCWRPVHFTEALEEQHRHCRIGADGLCPHRGIPLALGHKLADGSTVCAGHGLRWIADGEHVPLAAAVPAVWAGEVALP